MDFGIFSLMGVRDASKSSKRVIEETLEQTKLADELGYGAAWFAEHHFSNYCLCPSPLLVIAKCAAITKRIRLTTGILVLPLYEPARLLSEIAFVDALCGGRLALGVGSGYQPYEFDRFGVDLSKSKEMLKEFLELIDLSASNEFFSYRGKHYSIAETHIGPRLTDGMPQIWIGGDSEETYRLAASKDFIPIFSGRTQDAEGLIAYRSRCEQAFRDVGKPVDSMPIGTLRHACVTDSKAQAREYAENVRYQLRLAGALRRRQEIMEGTMLVDRPIEGEASVEGILNNLMIGDPETVAERAIAEIRAVRPVHMTFYFQLGNIDHRITMSSIERFHTQVVPLIEKELGPIANLGPALPNRRPAPTLPAEAAAVA